MAIFLILFIICIDILLACVTVNSAHFWCLWRPEKKGRISRNWNYRQL